MDNNHTQNFTESNNLLEQDHSSTIIYNADSDFSVNDNIFQTPHINNNNYSHQTNIVSTSTNFQLPQYDQRSLPLQSPFGSFNTATINPSKTEILSFDIPGFKVIFIPQQDTSGSFNTATINPSQTEILSFDIPGFLAPSYSQQDNTYSNCFSSDITNNQYVPQHDQLSHSQPTEISPLHLVHSTRLLMNPSQTGILSFDIPGFKVIFIPQQDNTYSSCFSSNQFTQF
jgi:hypothetical protein